MKRPIKLLTLLLVAQVGLALGLRLDRETAPGGGEEKLLAFASDRIDAIELTGPATEHLILKKGDGGWILPEHFDAGADAGKIGDFLSELGGLTRPWPVAKTADAEKRFKVDEKGFERKLILRSGDKAVATLLLGSSPGFRKVHARLSGEKEIYDIPFSTYRASLKTEDWIDRNLLRVKAEEIAEIGLPDCRLARRDEKMELEQLAENEQTDAGQAQKLLERLAGLSIRDVAGPAGEPLADPELKIDLTLKNGDTRSYAFDKGTKEGMEVLQVTGFPHLYEVDAKVLQDLKGFDRVHLVQAKAAPASAG